MKAFRSILKNLGFKPITRSILACRAGALVHVVYINKDRYGGDTISLVVTMPSLIENDEKLSVYNLQSPVTGCVSPRGVIGSWSWENGSFDADFVSGVLAGFFSQFATSADLRCALSGLWVPPELEPCLSLDAPVPASIEALPACRYRLTGGAISLKEAGEAVRQKLALALGPMGFTPAPTDDAVVARQRGKMFDAVRGVLDSFGTFVLLTAYPWPLAIERADKRWKNKFYPMLPHDVMQNNRPHVLTRQAFLEMDLEHIRSMLESGIQRSGELANHLQFAAQLGPEFGTIAAELKRIAE